MIIPPDYEERVYAGVLGKIIGVYLGRPFEGWSYQRILHELGEVTYYVNERLPGRPPLIVTDDDISGTFTFVRALADYADVLRGNLREITPAQIGQTWLNYLLERRTILWWGGMGNSTEHTAYMRLKQGIPAPRSGSIELNGKVVAEQIGAQIFIDGWAMVAPGDPGLAVDLARKAASVSHDGEAVYGAQVLAAMESLAFVEQDMDTLFDAGMSFIPRDSIIYRLLADVREWRRKDNDWRATRQRLEAHYGYDKYGGNCHIVPNHGVIALALAYAPDDFQRALMIASTCGWDTDCNAGNVGCLMGIKLGLAGIDNSPVDWRGPLADRLFLPSADGGRAITDAAQEALRLCRLGRLMAGQSETALSRPPRFNFELPGSLHGFRVEGGNATLENVSRPSATGQRSLAVHVRRTDETSQAADEAGIRISTATFLPADTLNMGGYGLIACPTLYPGQTVRACVSADAPATVHLFVRAYGADDTLMTISSQPVDLRAGESTSLDWQVQGVPIGSPIAEVGLHILAAQGGTVYLDNLTWTGAPDVVLGRPAHTGTLWQRAWIQACNDATLGWDSAFRVCQDAGAGLGLLIQGEREWSAYSVRARIRPHLARSAGIAACVQGLQRYYALLLCDDQKLRLLKRLDGEHVLGEIPFVWHLDEEYELTLTTQDNRLIGAVNGQALIDVRDTTRPLMGGAVALAIESGRLDCDEVAVSPAHA
ncbi:MAG: ADP-ribosylglycohydrolase family protein [Anaerolineae bacterium]|nr:ADP-ribosylglycohydrolase family protein [Thermoflexales bacterium]MDW8406781.1 ADP-ribosylglycohydrolase family protein [Anaerolineae bacterium]